MTTEQDDIDRIADAFGNETDRLAEFEETFENALADIDPFETYLERVVYPKDLRPSTVQSYERTFAQWKAFMRGQGRHPACPHERHVKRFAEHLLEDQGNKTDTVKRKLRKLSYVYEFWQETSAFPHPVDYDPISLGQKQVTFPNDHLKEPPELSTEELKERLETVVHIRDRAIIITQLKLGLRAGEVCNIMLHDVNLKDEDIEAHYETELGGHYRIRDKPNAVYIPPGEEEDMPFNGRVGNKSERPRILPLDPELRRLLKQWLLVRPDAETRYFFLSEDTHQQMGSNSINNIWKRAFHPEYAESETHRAVTSHYGRHFFTTYWHIERDVNRELVKYMRGDVVGKDGIEDHGSIDHYLHTYYNDIESLYREEPFNLGL